VKVLIVDDQRSARRVLRRMLMQLRDMEVLEAETADDAVRVAEEEPLDLLLVDIRLSDDPRDRAGLDVVTRLRALGNTTPAVVITALTEVAEVREAMRRGAQDYVFKDELAPEMLLPIVETHRKQRVLEHQVAVLSERVHETWGVSAIVGSSPAIERVRKTVVRLANSDVNVLIRGETGTGKELVARALHEMSDRRASPMVAVNCSTLPGTLVESLIFGHMRGAFTGAERRVRGQLEVAGEGTLLLDEIAEMPVELQSKLLRVIEDRSFRPLGSEQELPLRARVLAATHADIEDRIADGRFREDLFFRLNVVTVHVPTLMERQGDIPELVAKFVREVDRPLRFNEEAIAWLMARRWPGNVRELRNVVSRLALLADEDVIDADVLERYVRDVPSKDVAAEVDRIARALLSLPERLGSKLAVIERAVLHHAIEACGGNKSAAARLVGVHRKALERRWERLADNGDDDGEDS
jgi:DNA-binding NtrC family response regulator